jgi:hypothetical protein
VQPVAILWQNGEDRPFGLPYSRAALMAAAEYDAGRRLARWAVVSIAVFVAAFLLTLTPSLQSAGPAVQAAYLGGGVLFIGAGWALGRWPSDQNPMLEGVLLLLGCAVGVLLFILHFHGSVLPVPNMGMMGMMIFNGIMRVRQALRLTSVMATPPDPALREAARTLVLRAARAPITNNPDFLMMTVPRQTVKAFGPRGLLDGDYLLLTNSFTVLVIHWSEIAITPVKRTRHVEHAAVTLWGRTGKTTLAPAHLERLRAWQAERAVPGREMDA